MQKNRSKSVQEFNDSVDSDIDQVFSEFEQIEVVNREFYLGELSHLGFPRAWLEESEFMEIYAAHNRWHHVPQFVEDVVLDQLRKEYPIGIYPEETSKKIHWKGLDWKVVYYPPSEGEEGGCRCDYCCGDHVSVELTS